MSVCEHLTLHAPLGFLCSFPGVDSSTFVYQAIPDCMVGVIWGVEVDVCKGSALVLFSVFNWLDPLEMRDCLFLEPTCTFQVLNVSVVVWVK